MGKSFQSPAKWRWNAGCRTRVSSTTAAGCLKRCSRRRFLREVVKRYHEGKRQTRIFNHSINTDVPCRTRHMSAWAAEFDLLCNDYDVLIIQSSGNLQAVPTGSTARNRRAHCRRQALSDVSRRERLPDRQPWAEPSGPHGRLSGVRGL